MHECALVGAHVDAEVHALAAFSARLTHRPRNLVGALNRRHGPDQRPGTKRLDVEPRFDVRRGRRSELQARRRGNHSDERVAGVSDNQTSRAGKCHACRPPEACVEPRSVAEPGNRARHGPRGAIGVNRDNAAAFVRDVDIAVRGRRDADRPVDRRKPERDSRGSGWIDMLDEPVMVSAT